MTPELQALIEAVGVWRNKCCTTNVYDAAVAQAYYAYQQSLTTSPSCLPPAPKGKRWVRVEYTTGGLCGDMSLQGCDPFAPAVALEDYVLSWNGRWVPVYLESGCADGVMPSFARGRGFGWRLVDAPDCDSLEKIAELLESLISDENGVVQCPKHCFVTTAQRIRALIGEVTP